MCGIAGLFAYRTDGPRPDPAEVRRMTDAMATRGPDGEGLWASPEEGRVVLGHRRLSILDLSAAAAQPMRTEDGRLAITFNGEIYNYRELRQAMEARGWRFRSTSDTEVILALWDAHGPDLVHHLRGMFAFALWDQRQQRLFLARDPFGIKPLYLADDGSTLRFASQVKALMAGGGIKAAPDLAGWAGFHLLGYVPEPHTIYATIRALPAGQALLVDPHSQQTRVHFELNQELQAAEAQAQTLPEGEAQERLRAVLAQSVNAHLVADVPVGLFLSAGLDSTTIAALAAEQAPERLRALTLGFHEFQGRPEDETALAALAARHLGVDHATHWITRTDFEAHLDRALAAMDQPSIDGINTYFVSLAAAQAGMKVALSGLGGDELLAGYPSFHQVPRLAHVAAPFAHLPTLGRELRRLVAPLLPRHSSPKFASLLEYGGRFTGAYLLRRALHLPWELHRLLGTQDTRQGLEELDLMGHLDASIRGLTTDRARMMALEMGWYMQGQLLKDTDWAAMAHSLEVRVPLVDRDVFRALAPLQVGRAPLGKRHLPACPRAGLPEAIRHRPKTGFTTPVRAWAEMLYPRQGLERGLRGWSRVVSETKPLVRHPGPRRVLVLLPDGFGGHGGIAQYSRDLLEAVCDHPQVGEVVALPRIVPHRPGPMPGNLVWDTTGKGSKVAYLGAVLRTLLTTPYDLVLCGHLNLVPLAWLAGLWRRVPRAVFIYGIDAWRPTPSRLSNRLAKGFHAVASISAVTLARFQAWNGPAHSATLLPNAIHLGDYAPGPKPLYLLERYGLEGRKVLLTFGRMDSLERYKGFDEVLEAMPRLLPRIPDLVYILAGEGSDRARLMEKAVRLGVWESVVFTGRVPEFEKADHFRLADAYVMPSRGEGFGFVVLEALACGIPVVASSEDGTREAALDGRLGRLVDPADPGALDEAIEAALAQGLGPVPTDLAQFDFPAFQDRVHALLDQLWPQDPA
jgi:asparagine synthase (glutamine-hydrolysing)